MIIAISGLSGTGKSTVAKVLSEMTGLPIAIRDTNRPIRPGEQNGVDYNFVDTFNDDDYIGIEKFKVANGETWCYGTKKETVKKHCIMVVNPLGIEKLRNEYRGAIVDFMIYVDENIRLERIMHRNDNQSKEEIKRRSEADLKTFENYIPEFSICNDGLPSDAADKIISSIKEHYFLLKYLLSGKKGI